MRTTKPFLDLPTKRLVASVLSALPLLGPLLIQGQDATRFESNIVAFEEADAADPPPLSPIVFTGSSSIVGWPDLPGTFPQHPVLNRGFGGSEMSDLLYYFDRVVAAYTPNLVVVYEGDNDLAAGESVDEVYADYLAFLDRVKQSIPNTGVAFLAVKPSPSRVAYLEAQRELNTRLAAVAAADPHVLFIDVFTPMLDALGEPRPELFQADMLHMNAEGYTIWNALVGPVLDDWVSGTGQTLLFDFGATTTTTELGAAPDDDPSRHWNNVTVDLGTTPDAVLADLVTTTGSATPYGLEILSRFNGANTSGTAESDLFPADATRDSLFGNTEAFNGLSDVLPAFKLTGLHPQLSYSFTFYASRLSVSDNRETEFSVNGRDSVEVLLNAANNVNQGVVTPGIAPDDAGEIIIGLAPSANNDNANHFTYLGALRVDAALPQQPVIFTQEPTDQTVTEFEAVAFQAAVAGSPPYYAQWSSNNIAIPGANGLTLTLPSVLLSADGALFSVTVSNLSSTASSRSAVLHVQTDELPPQVIAVESANGLELRLTFDEKVAIESASRLDNYTVNAGASGLVSAVVGTAGNDVLLTLTGSVTGRFSVTVANVADLAGNPMAAPTTLFAEVPDLESLPWLLDFGATGSTTSYGAAPDDPDAHWNNVTSTIGGSASGQLPNLVNVSGLETEAGLVMVRRFTGANENGTTSSDPFPMNATRDSLYGNTETWSGVANVFPSFRLAGLNPQLDYVLTFYASRMGVSDNRETAYTVEGATTTVALLNAANNVSETVSIPAIRPDGQGDITVSIAPGPNNNNGYHFTYLGALQLAPVQRPRFSPPVLEATEVRLEWSGPGQLQWAPSLVGPWTSITDTPPYREPVDTGSGARFFRISTAGD